MENLVHHRNHSGNHENIRKTKLIEYLLMIFSPLEMTFARWQTEQLVNWLFGIGLGQYANECRKYYQNGLQLLNATSHELDKVD